MEMTVLEIGLKAATFVGIVVSATAFATGRAPFTIRLRSLVMGVGGVSLMIANAWVANVTLASLLVGIFLVGAGWGFLSVLRSVGSEAVRSDGREGPAEFTRVVRVAP